MPAAVFEAGWDLESLMPWHREGVVRSLPLTPDRSSY